MNADEYQQAALRTESPARPLRGDFATNTDRMLHAAIGLCTETGELQDAMKRGLYYGKQIDKTNVAEEFQDCLWYIAIGLDALGIKMSDAMDRNIEKLRVRFPDKFTEGQALNRDLDAERKALEAKPNPNIDVTKLDEQIKAVLDDLDQRHGEQAKLDAMRTLRGMFISMRGVVSVPADLHQVSGLRQQLADREAMLAQRTQQLNDAEKGKERHYNELRALRAKIKDFSDSNS